MHEDLLLRLEQRAYSWGPSQTHYIGNGVSMATADLRRTTVDKDLDEAIEAIKAQKILIECALLSMQSIWDDHMAGATSLSLHALGTVASTVAGLQEK